MHDLPTTEAALAASTDLRAVHVVALAHPDAALAAAAQAREAALAAAHDAANPGQLPMAVVTAFRADYRAGMAGDHTYAALSDGTHMPATSPDLPKRLAAADTSSGDRAALYAAKSRIAFPANVRVLQNVRAAAAAAASALIRSESESKSVDKTWADVQARPFGGVTAMRARIDAYEASMRVRYEAEVSALRCIAGIASDDAGIPIYDARALMARAAALDKDRDKDKDKPKSLALARAWDALRQLLFFLGVDRADTRVETWAGIPFTVWTVARGDAVGEIWVDCAAHARKQLRGITSRFRTRGPGPGMAYVSVPFASADSASDITWAQFITLAHEMGHGLHECLTPGTDDATQHYAEVPSTLLEQLVQTPLVAAAIGLGDWAAELLIGGPPFSAHQAMKDVAVARYAMDLFSSDGSENTVPVLTGLLPGYTAAGLDLHEETATPALVTLQSAYYLYILCDAIVAGVLPRVATRDDAALAQLWAFVTADDMRFVL